ncbi:MAG: hypothetical protein ACT4OL_12415 [Nitrospiraceae bacterium]
MRLDFARSALLTAVLLLLVSWSFPLYLSAAPYFEDGLLGLTREELHDMLGMPQAVRTRQSALRVFTYYPITDRSQYINLVSPENGEDVYTFKRDGIDIRYSFSYAVNPNVVNENRPLFVRLVDIELSPAVPIARLPSLIPEFHPSAEPASPAFRSNIWVLLFKGTPSPVARFIVKERGKDQLDWTLTYQLFSLQGFPEPLTMKVMIDRVEIGAQSLQFVRLRQHLTHEAILNPFSPEYTQQLHQPTTPAKQIPLPKYAE